jgi:hypothetical protein
LPFAIVFGSIFRYSGVFVAMFVEAIRVARKAALSTAYKTQHGVTELPDSVRIGSFVTREGQSKLLYEVVGYVDHEVNGSGVYAQPQAESVVVFVPKDPKPSEAPEPLQVVVSKEAWSEGGWPSVPDGWAIEHASLGFHHLPLIALDDMRQVDMTYVEVFSANPPFVDKYYEDEDARLAAIKSKRAAQTEIANTQAKKQAGAASKQPLTPKTYAESRGTARSKTSAQTSVTSLPRGQDAVTGRNERDRNEKNEVSAGLRYGGKCYRVVYACEIGGCISDL